MEETIRSITYEELTTELPITTADYNRRFGRTSDTSDGEEPTTDPYYINGAQPTGINHNSMAESPMELSD